MKRKTSPPPRLQMGCQWNTEAEARAIREFRARLALDGLTFKGWLSARIADYMRRAPK